MFELCTKEVVTIVLSIRSRSIMFFFFSDVLEKKSGPDDDENDLLTELKIMSCLGSHPNILNLFGACTIKGM